MITRWYRRLLGRGDADARLDEFLDAADEELLTALDSLDLDAGLDAIIDRPTAEAAAAQPGGQAAQICQDLTRLVNTIAPGIGHPEQARASTFYLQTAAAMLAELETRLGSQVISREEALRLLRLAQHNLIEAVPLLLGESSARRRSASSAEAKRQLGLAQHAAEQINPMFLRVSKLFDDAGQHAVVPAPPGPR